MLASEKTHAGTDDHSQMEIQVVADIVRKHGQERPEAIAMIYNGQETSYGNLDQRTNQVANGLIAAGLAPQTRVAHIDKNADNFYELLYGTAKSNTVLVSVNWRLAAPEVAFVINDAQAELLFVGPDYYALVEGLRDELSTVKTVIALNGGHPQWESYEEWRDRQTTADPYLPIAADDVAMQLYTSGTTGHPKGAQLTNENIMTGLRGADAYVPLAVDDVNLVCMPFFHIAGSAWGNVGLYQGIQNVIMREIIPAEILRLIETYGVTTAFFVPAVILFMLQTPTIQTTDLSSLKLIVYGASPIPLDLLRRALTVFGCDFVQVYGLTETTGTITCLPAADHLDATSPRLRSCGKPLPTAEIRIVDVQGNEMPVGEVGEIICRSLLNMKGYWNLPEATAVALRDGWFYSGDAGYLDEDGYVYIYDRIKDMIISGGENIYPAEVESAIFAHPAVADAAIIGVPDDTWGESVKAVVVVKPGSEVTAEELIAFARERIAGYKAPKSVDFVEALPRNPSGKILKRELRRPYWEGYERHVN